MGTATAPVVDRLTEHRTRFRDACGRLLRHLPRLSQGTSLGSGSRSCAGVSFALAEQSSDEAGPAHLVLVHCGSRRERGSDACSRAEARAREFRLTPLDRHTSANHPYGIPCAAWQRSPCSARRVCPVVVRLAGRVLRPRWQGADFPYERLVRSRFGAGRGWRAVTSDCQEPRSPRILGLRAGARVGSLSP
jgi:hypothetical protein